MVIKGPGKPTPGVGITHIVALESGTPNRVV